MPKVFNPHQREVRYARQASADACAFCRLLAIRPEAQYTTETAALFAHNEIGNLYHDECNCTAVAIDPGETYEMPDYTQQWEDDYVAARDDPDTESFEDVLNHMRRAEYARDNSADEQPTPNKPAAGKAIMDVVTKSVEAEVRPVVESDHPNGEFEVVLSTERLDRDGEHLWIDEWKTPLPAKIHIDSDHGMSVEKTVGSAVPRIEGNLMIGRGTYAGTEHAQMVRGLVADGHITSMSVTYGESKNRKSGKPQRELWNAAFVPVPANPAAVVLSSKGAKQLDASGNNPDHDDNNKDNGHAQNIHDHAVALGAQCTNAAEADTGEADGANKHPDTSSIRTKGAGTLQESADESAAADTTAHKAAVSAAADESADPVARQHLAMRGKAFAINTNYSQED